MIPLLTLSLLFSDINPMWSTNSNGSQACTDFCSVQGETCQSKLTYYLCLKTQIIGKEVDCEQELNTTEEYICKNCDRSNSNGLTPEEAEKTSKCAGPILDERPLGNVNPHENCWLILGYLKCRSETEVQCKITPGGPSYTTLYEMASNLCTGANNSVYENCDRFLVEYKKIFVVEQTELLFTISDRNWWCRSFKAVLIAAGVKVGDETDCEALTYDALSRNISVNNHPNWTEYCYIAQEESSPSPSSSSSPSSPPSTWTSVTSLDLGTDARLISAQTETTETTLSQKITERNGGEQLVLSLYFYFYLFAHCLATVM